ncbi:hypothetical protein [Marinoscillum sp.]|uniref:hypothetical protein n=1 Tax=Marinoscillum sp. TaxID=2024838 RepID=UPI003BAA3A40
MKKLLPLLLFLSSIFHSFGQTVDVQYLNPKHVSTGTYKFIRFGTPSEFTAGFMYNISHPTYGDGNDFTIFTYDNRDLAFRTGTGNIFFFPSEGGNIGIGTTNLGTYKMTLKQDHSSGAYGFRIVNAEDTKSAQLWVGSGGAVLDAEGTTNLHFRTAGQDRIFVKNDGKVGIGNSNPREKLHVEGRMYLGEHINGAGSFYESKNGADWFAGIDGSDRFRIYRSGNKFLIDGSGRVAIGTNSPDAKLTVKGNIHAEEVKVDLNVPGPDYVFEEDYDLLSLDELKEYITVHKHLPEVPSAKEMDTNGINLSEMNMLLLKKVEELTLHQIELMSLIKEDRELIKAQYQEMEILKSKIESTR